MDMSKSRDISLATAILLVYGLLILHSGVKAQSVVDFTVGSASVLVDQTVNFQCTSNDFDPTQDLLEIRFQDELLMQFINGRATYFNEREEMYYAVHVVSIGDGKSIIQLTINQVNTDDTGDYTCHISQVSPGEMVISGTSTPIRLVVQYFLTPACFVGHRPDISYSRDTGQLNVTRSGISVTLICSAQAQPDDMSVVVEWSVSDGRITEPSSPGTTTFTFTSSLSDNGVDFTCTSSSPSFPNVAYQCTVTVFTLNDLRITSTISDIVNTNVVSTTSTTVNPIPNVATADVESTLPTTLTPTKLDVEVITSTLNPTHDNVSTVHESFTTYRSSTSTLYTDKPCENKNDRFVIGLAAGVGGTIGLLVVVFVLVVIVFCVYRQYKGKQITNETQDMQDMQDKPYYSTRITDNETQETPYYSSSLPICNPSYANIAV